MKGNQIRSAFVEYFEKKNHRHLASSSTVPKNDPTLLFTNAGMNQFKDYFLGNSKPDFLRAVTIQKIIRAGGKHNDLENVGKTARHHTFFEMLGNFSFGDYFKETAIIYAWEFLTKVLALPKNNFAISIYEQDEESFTIWNQKIGIAEDRIAKLGKKDNFWSMGDTGPCGPCSEIHFDLKGKQGNNSIIESLEKDDGRFLEVWNLVFMQFDKQKNKELKKLPSQSVDTGMGLERIASIVQNVDSNYKTDLFTPIINKIAEMSNYNYGTSENLDTSVKVIADHVRSSTIMVADGIIPANEGRNYVLRRIIRRALLHANNLKLKTGSFAKLSSFFAAEIEIAYPEIRQQQKWIKKILQQEEYRFASTLNRGVKLLKALIQNNKKHPTNLISGKEIFKLYDTFGFPLDLAEDLLATEKMDYNKQNFEAAMQYQKDTAKKSQSWFSSKQIIKPLLKIQKNSPKNNFVGYTELETEAIIGNAWNQEQELTQIKEGDNFFLLLDKTPFYAESGGQIGDSGSLTNREFTIEILDTQKSPSGINYSWAKLARANKMLEIKEKHKFIAKVDSEKRKETANHHTATHLLHAVLREVLGIHIKPAGCLVSENRLRFDFQHFEALDDSKLEEIEKLVNQYIRENEIIETKIMPLDLALKTGALAFFEDKYQEQVRVVQVGSHSKELCGGCHAKRTSDLTFLKIISETSISAGTRRIEAITGASTYTWHSQQQDKLLQINQLLQNNSSKSRALEQILNGVTQKINQIKQLEVENKTLKQKILNDFTSKVIQNYKSTDKLLFFENTTILTNKEVVEKLVDIDLILIYQKKSGNLEVLLTINKKIDNFHAGNFIKDNCYLIKGKGGGSSNIAQCRGNKIDGVEKLKLCLQNKIF